MKLTDIKKALDAANLNISEDAIAAELKQQGLNLADVNEKAIGVLVAHFQSTSGTIQPQVPQAAQTEAALSLRSDLAHGAISPSDLSREQIQCVLASIDAEAAASTELDDGTIALFIELSDQVAQLDKLTQMAQFASSRLQDKRSGFQGAVSNLVDVVNDGLKQDAVTASQLKEVNAAIGGSFRRRNVSISTELDRIKSAFGVPV